MFANRAPRDIEVVILPPRVTECTCIEGRKATAKDIVLLCKTLLVVMYNNGKSFRVERTTYNQI